MRRRLLAALGALGGSAVLGSLVRGLEAPASGPTGSTTTSRVVVPDVTTTSVARVSSTVPPPPSPEPDPPASTVASVDVVVACRAAWGAAPAGGGMEPHQPVRLTLHHTAVSQTSLTQGPERARRHQRYHQSLGWPDLAYHFLVDRAGLAYEGRDVAFRGDTGTEYDPTGHFLVCMEGDFDDQEPTTAQIATTVGLFAWASQEYGIDPATLAGHGDYAETTCPGAFVLDHMPSMAGAIAIAGSVSLDLRCGLDGEGLVASIEAGD